MTGVDLHPEDLLDRVRRGTASDDERRRAAAHIAGCLACRAEQVLLSDAARAAADVPGDDEKLARVRSRAGRAVRARMHGRGARRRTGHGDKRRGARLRLRFAPALIVLLVAAAAAATPFVYRVWRPRAARVAAGAPAPGTPLVVRTHEAPPPAGEEAPASESPLPRSRVARPATRAARNETRVVPAGSRETAAGLFARANQARREGSPAEVIALYRRLQTEFAGSSEAAVSQVALGRWFLDRMHDPAAALAQFDAYLRQSRQDTLREEALVGRAMALQQLRRGDEERRAWEALLAAYPGSTFAGRARARIDRTGTP